MGKNMDLSLAFTALLDLDRDGFGKEDMRHAGQIVSEFLRDFRSSGETDMYEYARNWVKDRRTAGELDRAEDHP